MISSLMFQSRILGLERTDSFLEAFDARFVFRFDRAHLRVDLRLQLSFDLIEVGIRCLSPG